MAQTVQRCRHDATTWTLELCLFCSCINPLPQPHQPMPDRLSMFIWPIRNPRRRKQSEPSVDEIRCYYAHLFWVSIGPESLFPAGAIFAVLLPVKGGGHDLGVSGWRFRVVVGHVRMIHLGLPLCSGDKWDAERQPSPQVSDRLGEESRDGNSSLKAGVSRSRQDARRPTSRVGSDVT